MTTAVLPQVTAVADDDDKRCNRIIPIDCQKRARWRTPRICCSGWFYICDEHRYTQRPVRCMRCGIIHYDYASLDWTLL